MTDWAGIAALVAAICSGLALLMSTVNGILSSRRQVKNEAAIATVTSTVVAVKTDMKELTTNTNSIKDALVAVTEKEAFARGVKTEKDDPGKH